MGKSELRCQLFNDILKAAVEENLMRSLDAIPSEEELKKEYAPSLELRQRVQRMVKKEYHKTLLRKAARNAKRVAVIIAIIIPISLGSLLSVKASRNVIFNSVLEWKADHVDIYFQEMSSHPSEQVNSDKILLTPQYLPNGFSKSEEIKIGPLYRITYQNKENVSIIFDRAPLPEEGKMMVDTEHTIYKGILINGQKASLFTAKTANDKTYILWHNNKTSLMISSTINQDELIKIAESTIIKKN